MKPYLFAILLLTSCSNLKRQKLFTGVVGAVLGGVIGAQIGKSLSPDQRSIHLNQAIGAGVGIGTGFIAGSYIGESFWDDKKNLTEQQHLLFPPNESKSEKPKIKILDPKKVEQIKLETKLPDFLKGKVKEANVLTYEIEEFEEETDDGRKIYHAPHKAYEYVLE